MSRRLVVTGGASGIGAAVVRTVVAEGGRAVALDLADPDGMAALEGVDFVRCDVTDAGGTQTALAEAAGLLGGLDAVYAAAGMLGTMAPVEHLTPEEWRDTLAVNLDGFFHTVRAAVPLMGAGGAIVGTSSVHGLRTFAAPGGVAYGVAKAGLVAFVQTAAVELARHGVRINAVAPGKVGGTRLLTANLGAHDLDDLEHERIADVPLAGETTTADVVAAVRFLLSDQARRITGTVLAVDAGQSLLGGGMLKARP
ncbi:SDR family NAD(P)-dependent oxidoreductase [Nocardioides sp.]|uniref:SDR family oxidoreductase n=1 Tax=Nocardioides sp. TaxID=35761 RepID=UPI0025D00A4C|nr:SDR family NAD(P)-dependent oxidoreductase [Nocardioides sp.]